MLLTGQDVSRELLDPATDDVGLDGMGEGLATQGDQLLGFLLTESGSAMSSEDGGDSLWASHNELLRQDVVLE